MASLFLCIGAMKSILKLLVSEEMLQYFALFIFAEFSLNLVSMNQLFSAHALKIVNICIDCYWLIRHQKQG